MQDWREDLLSTALNPMFTDKCALEFVLFKCLFPYYFLVPDLTLTYIFYIIHGMHPFFFICVCMCVHNMCITMCSQLWGSKNTPHEYKIPNRCLHRFSPRGFGSRLGVNHSRRPYPWFVPLRHATVRNATSRCLQKWSFFLLFYSRHGNYQHNLLSVNTSHSRCKLHEVIRTVTIIRVF